MKASRLSPTKYIQDRVVPVVVLIYHIIALIAFAAIPLLAYNQLQPFSLFDQLTLLYIPYLVGLVYLLSGLWVFSLRRWDPSGRAFSIFTTSAALSIALLFDLNTNRQLAGLWVIALAFTGGALLNLALIFPQEILRLKHNPLLSWIAYLPSLGLATWSIIALIKPPSSSFSLNNFHSQVIFTLASALIFIIEIGYRRYTSKSPIVRSQSRHILWGALLSFFLPCLGFLASFLLRQNFFSSFFLLTLLTIIVFPIAFGYTILRYRLLRTDYISSRATLYALLTVITATAYALLVTGLSIIFGATFPITNPFIFGSIIFFFAVIITPLKNGMQQWVDAAFSHGQAVYRERLTTFTRELTQATELRDIILLLRRYIEEGLHPAQLHIFLFDALSDHYAADPGNDGHPTSDLRFSVNSPLVQALSHRRNSIFMGESYTLPTALQGEKARLSLLGALLFIPLPGKAQLTGWIALGLRQSGDPYGDHDLNYLESLSDQAALAIERAQVVANLERRMHEMNVLTRVSQGINVTIAFDDILELIYAQTNQVIPTLDFRITLRDHYSNYLYHVFYLENDERFFERENLPLALGQGLEQEVVKIIRPLITDDYERECRSHGVLPTAQGLFAWIGVPLNAGSETIGALSLGSRDPAVIYTSEQCNLLQAIADQAAGAIVKARLLQESERRTRQLTSLNEVARSLTSTLELDRLLNQILNSAVEILNCEAGSLFLVDDQTDELVFEVVVGPVAGDLLGQRLPPGTGLVGKSVETRQAIIANDVRRTKEWFDITDQQTGFVTQDMLVVPMQIKDRVIGVIEVINRKDRLPFIQDDQGLLAAFTSQAAVAIENARLYTMTDQALAARVEELSVMQRIDRELNASLDVDRALRITLSWAMRQSESDAGLVGMVEENGIRLMASQGYTTELSFYQSSYLPLDLFANADTLQNGQLLRLRRSDSSQPFGLLDGVESQVIVPIRRESKTIGLILMECRQADSYPEETIDFLIRLSDHATIAIANAQLYSQVEAANLAKSEFVSFVSHELKTPMTSIKGFADLLAAGVVGPINEAQGNFLSTIRSNVDRMATLVSDLADVSRIESGRLRLEFTSIPVSDIVDEVTRSVRSQIDAKGQSLSVQIPAQIPSMWGDRTRIIQILTNLVNNAYKYSPQGGSITVCAEAARNQWDKNGAPEVIHISVMDTGFGINPEDQKKIFQKFFRSEDQSIRDASGTGLGLNITKTLVEMQGGMIWFDTEFRKGTTFHFTIPVAESN